MNTTETALSKILAIHHNEINALRTRVDELEHRLDMMNTYDEDEE